MVQIRIGAGFELWFPGPGIPRVNSPLPKITPLDPREWLVTHAPSCVHSAAASCGAKWGGARTRCAPAAPTVYGFFRARISACFQQEPFSYMHRVLSTLRLFCDSPGLRVRCGLGGLRERSDPGGLRERSDPGGLRERFDLCGLARTTAPDVTQLLNISRSSISCKATLVGVAPAAGTLCSTSSSGATLSPAHAHPPFGFFGPTFGGTFAPLAFGGGNSHGGGNFPGVRFFSGAKKDVVMAVIFSKIWSLRTISVSGIENGRCLPEHCSFIQVTFVHNAKKKNRSTCGTR